MKVSRFAKTACAFGLSALCVLAVAGCTDSSANSNSGSSSATGGVAATVNGEPISEDLVTNYIESLRAQYGLTEEGTWGQYLASSGLTPESLRENIINSYVERELMEKGAADAGIVADEATVQGYVDSMKSNYDSEEKWQEALAAAGMTEDDYREEIARQLVSQEFSATFQPTEDPTEEEMLQYAQMYASMLNGAKRSSHILFAADDEATAQEVLDQLRAGTLDFAEAAQTYSQDGSAENGGDVGWDKMTTFVTEYQDALNELDKDEISDLVVSQYGIHIIKCTDVFQPQTTTADDGTTSVTLSSVSELPADFQDMVKSATQSQKGSENYQAWLTEQRETAEIVINPMPEDVPYNVDMSKFSATSSLSGANGTVTEEATVDETTVDVQPEGDAAGTDDTQTEEPGNTENAEGADQQNSGTGNAQ